MLLKPIHGTSESLPAIGQGTGFGNFLAKLSRYGAEHIDALRYGIDLGMTFIDTSEEYGSGQSEEMIGEALEGIRDRVFIASKVSSANLRYDDVISSAEASLRRLRTDYLDLYQIHWPSHTVPLSETMEAMNKLLADGKIRYVGACNLTMKEIMEAEAAASSGKFLSVQAEYNLVDHTLEESLLPYCRSKNLVTIGYSPLLQGRIGDDAGKMNHINDIAEKYGKTPAQVVLNWIISHETVITIPQSINFAHLKQNAEAAGFTLSGEDLSSIDSVFASEIVEVPPCRIRVYEEGKGASMVYRTVEEALRNSLSMAPSPSELARNISEGEILKPIKLKKTSDTSGRYDYDLAEGRLRYWAWVIAFGDSRPISALIRN